MLRTVLQLFGVDLAQKTLELKVHLHGLIEGGTSRLNEGLKDAGVTFGIALLTLLVVNIASSFLGFPIGIIGQVVGAAVGPQYALLVLVVTQALSQVVAAAFVTPFTLKRAYVPMPPGSRFEEYLCENNRDL